MSAAALAWAFAAIEIRGDGLTAAMKLVLLRLADRADPQGLCWPGHERTARDLNLSESTVRGAIAALARAGFLDVIRRRDADGRDKPNLYRLHVTDAQVPVFGTRIPKRGDQAPKSAPEPQNRSNLKEKQKQPTALETIAVDTNVADARGLAAASPREKAGKRPGSPLEIIDGIRVYRATDDAERLGACRQRVAPDVFHRLVEEIPAPRYVSQVEARIDAYLAAESARAVERERAFEKAKAREVADARLHSPSAIAARDAALKQLAGLLGVKPPDEHSPQH